jgi:hypothetical protein
MNKICSWCKEEKLIEEFHKNAKYCKICSSLASKRHAAANPELHRQKSKEAAERAKVKPKKIVFEKTCTKCKITRSINEFGTANTSPDNHLTTCLPCARAEYKEKTKFITCKCCNIPFEKDKFLIQVRKKEYKHVCIYCLDKIFKMQCTKCEETKGLTDFYNINSGANYFFKHCKSCRTLINSQITGIIKLCCGCNLLKYCSYFNKSNDSYDGCFYLCKECLYEERQTQEYRDKTNAATRKRMANDPIFKLRCRISSIIATSLKSNNGSKSGESVMKYLPYTIQELKDHIEFLWEPWMNWDNYGMVSLSKRTWQVDHIIAQSLLPYDSMEHPNFQKCWALSNLQPLCSLENARKGNKPPSNSPSNYA